MHTSRRKMMIDRPLGRSPSPIDAGQCCFQQVAQGQSVSNRMAIRRVVEDDPDDTGLRCTDKRPHQALQINSRVAAVIHARRAMQPPIPPTARRGGAHQRTHPTDRRICDYAVYAVTFKNLLSRRAEPAFMAGFTSNCDHFRQTSSKDSEEPVCTPGIEDMTRR